MAKEKLNSDHSSWFGYAGNLTIGTIGGTIIGGITGGTVIGGIVGGTTALASTITDEYLIKHNYTGKHYLTSTALWTAIILPAAQTISTLIPKEYTTSLYVASFGLVSTIAYLGYDPLNCHSKVDEITSNLTPMVKLFDDHNIISSKELNKLVTTFKTEPIKAIKIGAQDIYHLSNNTLVKTLSTNIALDFVNAYMNSSFIKYVGNNGTTMLALTLLAQNPEAQLKEIAWSGFKISALWCTKNIIGSAINFYKNSLQYSLTTAIEEKAIKKILLNKEHTKKILQLEKVNETTSNLSGDFSTLFTMGKAQLEIVTNKKIIELIALKDILSIAPESILLSQIIGFVRKKIENHFATKSNEITRDSMSIYHNKYAIKSDFSNNFKNAILTKSEDLIKENYLSIAKTMSTISNKSDSLQAQKTTVFEIYNVIEIFLDLLYYGYKVTSKNLTIEQAPLLKTWVSECSSLLQGGVSTAFFSTGPIAQERVKILLEAISSEYVSSVDRDYNDQHQISFKDYKLMLENKDKIQTVVVELDNLIFTKKHNAILGKSGLGKTTILKDLMECLTKPHSSSGKISLPKINDQEPKIMFIDQNLYIPAKATLFEAITLRSATSINNEEKKSLDFTIIELFKELEMDYFAAKGLRNKGLTSLLNDPNFDTNNLSGGQKKKIGIIKAIICKPDILIADEVFVGLDKN
mgnify:CR=1 FL=1